MKNNIYNSGNENEKNKDKKQQQVLFTYQDYRLPFRPFELNHVYAVTYTIKKGKQIQVLEQNYSVRRLKPDTSQDDYHFIQIEKISDLRLNGERVDRKAYEAAEKTAALLYPLRIVVNKYGKWIDINSYHKLKERWENQKGNIKEWFDGKTFELLTKNMEDTIKDDALLVRLLSGSWFLRAYFNGIHRAYTRSFETERKLFFPVVAQTEDIEFSIIQKVNPYLNDLNQIEVTQNGETASAYLSGNYSSKYFLNPNNYIIQEIQLDVDLEMSSSRKIQISIKKIGKDKIVVDSEISVLV